MKNLIAWSLESRNNFVRFYAIGAGIATACFAIFVWRLPLLFVAIVAVAGFFGGLLSSLPMWAYFDARRSALTERAARSANTEKEVPRG